MHALCMHPYNCLCTYMYTYTCICTYMYLLIKAWLKFGYWPEAYRDLAKSVFRLCFVHRLVVMFDFWDGSGQYAKGAVRFRSGLEVALPVFFNSWSPGLDDLLRIVSSAQGRVFMPPRFTQVVGGRHICLSPGFDQFCPEYQSLLAAHVSDHEKRLSFTGRNWVWKSFLGGAGLALCYTKQLDRDIVTTAGKSYVAAAQAQKLWEEIWEHHWLAGDLHVRPRVEPFLPRLSG